MFNIPIKFKIGLFLSSSLVTALVKGEDWMELLTFLTMSVPMNVVQLILVTWTTLTTQQREKGKVRKMRMIETTINMWAHMP